MSRITGQTILITGATDGIGLALARQLQTDNYLLLLGRSDAKLKRLFGDVSNVKTYTADLSKMAEVRSVAKSISADVSQIDLLIHNASCVSSERVMTEDDFELQLTVNYLAPVLLTSILLPMIENSGGSLIFINSRAHKRARFTLSDPQLESGYDLSLAYNRSKLYLMLFAKRLSELVSERGINVNSIHPGLVNTTMGEKNCNTFHQIAWKLMKQLGKSPDAAAMNIISLINSDEFKDSNGAFFGPKGKCKPSSIVKDSKATGDLWKLTENLLKTSIL